MPERDIFANFDRMRREMDELFGDVFERLPHRDDIERTGRQIGMRQAAEMDVDAEFFAD